MELTRTAPAAEADLPAPDDEGGGLDEAVWAGINRLLDDYLGVAEGDVPVICYTPDVRLPAAWVGLALAERGLRARTAIMAPVVDPDFADRLATAMPPGPPADGRLILLLFENISMSHNAVIRAALDGWDPGQYRVVRGINAGRDLFATGLRVGPEELSARNTAILERCQAVRDLQVETDAGTDLRIRLDNDRFRWVSNRGMPPPGKFLVIPCGEVATFSAAIDGTLVADFALNVNTGYRGDARLDRHPVRVEIENGRMTDFACEDPDMHAFLSRCFERDNAERVGELGFGTNPAVAAPVFENSHLNERSPGIHIGFGQHNQTVETAGYFCDIHVDLIARGGRIHFAGDPDPLDLAALVPSDNPHPELVQSEDLFSPDDLEDDCCGMLR